VDSGHVGCNWSWSVPILWSFSQVPSAIGHLLLAALAFPRGSGTNFALSRFLRFFRVKIPISAAFSSPRLFLDDDTGLNNFETSI
jgi:hypothetical protein